MSYERLQVIDHVDKWTTDKLKHIEDGIIANEEAIASLQRTTQSDWRQNDRTAPDYIKNRPFYESEEKIFFIESTGLIEENISINIADGEYILEAYDDVYDLEAFRLIIKDQIGKVGHPELDLNLAEYRNGNLYLYFPPYSSEVQYTSITIKRYCGIRINGEYNSFIKDIVQTSIEEVDFKDIVQTSVEEGDFAVSTTTQTLTAEQQKIARENIGVFITKSDDSPVHSVSEYLYQDDFDRTCLHIRDLDEGKLYASDEGDSIRIIYCDTTCWLLEDPITTIEPQSLFWIEKLNVFEFNLYIAFDKNEILKCYNIKGPNENEEDWEDKGVKKTNKLFYLSTDNISSYTPTSDYHPATKKYVDETISECLPKINAIPNITEAPTAEDFNNLLQALRDAGYLAIE